MAEIATKRPIPAADLAGPAIARMLSAPEPFRRDILAGLSAPALAAALALPAEAAPAGPHPDAALFAAEAAYLHAQAAYELARLQADAAHEAYEAAIGLHPQELSMSAGDLQFACGPGAWSHGFRSSHTRWISPNLPTDEFMRRAWTADGLRTAIREAPGRFGPAGRTPYRIHRWRGLLPVAEAFDAQCAEVDARFRVEDLVAAASQSSKARDAAEVKFSRMPATTLAGLALKVRHMDGFGWMGMGAPWIALLQSAAAVSGVSLREPTFDCQRWATELRAAGGYVTWDPDAEKGGVTFPVRHEHTAEQRTTLMRLSNEQRVNRDEIGFWLSQGGAA